MSGSKTAKNGLLNEYQVIEEFNQKTQQSIEWLTSMGYDIHQLTHIHASKVKGRSVKPDIKVVLKQKDHIDEISEYISLKLVSTQNGFNQIDKRSVDRYAEIWSMHEDIQRLLKLFTGKIQPNAKQTIDPRRMYMHEFEKEQQDLIVNFFRENKSMIVTDLLKGSDHGLQANWILVIQKNNDQIVRSIICDMDLAIHFFQTAENGLDVSITNRGNLKIGRIGMQRKGGDNGAETSKMLQFKLDPTDLFDLIK